MRSRIQYCFDAGISLTMATMEIESPGEIVGVVRATERARTTYKGGGGEMNKSSRHAMKPEALEPKANEARETIMNT